jgi:hypothetical protein
MKGEANHWFRAAALPGQRFVVSPWSQGLREPDATELHLCGMSCVTKLLTRTMGEEAICRELPPADVAIRPNPWMPGKALR